MIWHVVIDNGAIAVVGYWLVKALTKHLSVHTLLQEWYKLPALLS